MLKYVYGPVLEQNGIQYIKIFERKTMKYVSYSHGHLIIGTECTLKTSRAFFNLRGKNRVFFADAMIIDDNNRK